jgi:hypothetical protein
MDVGQLKQHFRRQIDDTVTPYLVSDQAFYEYLTEAQQEACIRSDLISDKVSSFCSIAVTAGKSVYSLNSLIYAITYAEIVDGNGIAEPLASTTEKVLDQWSKYWRSQSEKPRWFIQSDNTIELVPKPTENATLKIECYRMPIEDIAGF